MGPQNLWHHYESYLLAAPACSLSLKSPWCLLTLLWRVTALVYLLDFAHLWKSAGIINGLVSIDVLLGWNSNCSIYGKPLNNEMSIETRRLILKVKCLAVRTIVCKILSYQLFIYGSKLEIRTLCMKGKD